MAFWSSWFKPSCASCGAKILEQPIDSEDGQICAKCHESHLAERAAAEAEREARRLAEEEARRKLEERKVFGPRE